ncbi:MAG: hypothetical protein QOE83_2501 [Actinomycetota bacterium]|jgi:MFS family permease|nr:hypothetical protein [Actinomycetota bacterium]
MTAPGSIARTRDALRSHDFRRLLAVRLCSQAGDGLFQAALVASVVFSPSNQSTAGGLFRTTLIVALPFSIIGPFTGVFIDRWARRRILMFAPLLRALFAALVLSDPHRAPFAFYTGALVVLSVNRFHLATAQAVVPRLVPAEDLLMANSVATVGGTLSLLVGMFAGGKIADAYGGGAIVTGAIVLWLATSAIASRIRSDLTPAAAPEDPGLIRHQIKRVAVEFKAGVRVLATTPRAIGPITAITVDQFAQGILLTLSLVVFRDKFKEGVGSYANLIAAGGIGVFVGISTIGWLEQRFARARIVAGSFLAGGIAVGAAAVHVTGGSVLFLSFVVGLTFTWKKIPIDTMVQESVPDAFRGRAFSVYDVAYNGGRILAAGLAVKLIPWLGVVGTLAVTSFVLVAWTPILPRWLRSRTVPSGCG